MNFKEFLSQPAKKNGYIEPDGKIHYSDLYPRSAWIRFQRVNLEGSNRNSFWKIDVPNMGDQVRDALRIWALNMPEYYSDDIILQKREIPYGSTKVEKVANFDFSIQRLSENKQTVRTGIVSFDFDGVLHVDMVPDSIHPAIWDHGNLRPRKEYVQRLIDEKKAGNEIIIVSSRCEESRPEIEEFLEINKLPVDGIYLTCMKPKIPLLMKLGAIRHYDDDVASIRRQIDHFNSDIDFVAVPMCTLDDVA